MPLRAGRRASARPRSRSPTLAAPARHAGAAEAAAGTSGPVAVAVVADADGLLRVRRDARAATGAGRRGRALPPHAEARGVRVEDGALVVAGRGVDGDARRAWSPATAATAPRSPRRRSATAGRFRARLELAALARAGVWDLRLGDRRVGAHRDGLPGKKDDRRVPRAARRRARAAAVLHGRGQPLDPRRAGRAAGAGRAGRRPAPSRAAGACSAALAVALHRARARRSPRALPRARRGRAGPASAVRILLLHAYGLGGTVRTSFNLAEGLARRPRRRADQPDAPPRRAVLRRSRAARRVRASTTSAERARAARAARPPAQRARSTRRTTRTRTRACGPTSRSLRRLRALRGGVLITTRPAFNLLAARLAAPGVRHDRPGAHELPLAPPAARGRPPPPLPAGSTCSPCSPRPTERDYARRSPAAPPRIVRIPNAVPRAGRRHRAARRQGRGRGGPAGDAEGLRPADPRPGSAWPRAHPDWQLRIYGSGAAARRAAPA